MRAVKLKLRSPNVDGITADPQPDWSFENVLLEIEKIEKKLNASSNVPATLTKTQPREFQASQETNNCSRGFVMHVSDNELEETESDCEEEVDDPLMVKGTRFACDEYYIRDDAENELPLRIPCLMNKVGLVEGALSERICDLQFSVSEEVRNQISTLETYVANENEKFASIIDQVEKQRVSQRERDKKYDLQYQRTIAEALDNHLTAVQRDHEHRSQIEERRLREDAMREEVKRKAKAQQERLWQEEIKAEEEARVKAERAAQAEKAAVEAERRAAEEAALKVTVEPKTDTAAKTLADSGETEVQLSGNIVKAASNALELEERRLRTYKEIYAKNEAIRLRTNKIPLAMDILLAELNRACIYTVPKNISDSTENFKTKIAYYKAIGYKEEDGKIESTDSYLERLNAYMKLYGALVQTEVNGFQNLHGLKEGWAWLARFLNALPANRYKSLHKHTLNVELSCLIHRLILNV